MALFNHDEDTQDSVDPIDTRIASNPNDVGPISLPESPEVTPDYYQTVQPTVTTTSRRPLSLIISILVALLVLFGLIMGGRWVYHEFKNSNNNGSHKPATAQPTAPKNSSKPKTSTPPSSSAAPAPSTAAPTPAQTEAPQPSTTPTPPSAATTPSTPAAGSLTNTGPGQTLAIFALVSSLGVILYQLRLRLSRARG